MVNYRYMRRITDIVSQHWKDVKGMKAFPSINDLDHSILEPVWDNCFIVEVKDIITNNKYSYTYLGSNLFKAFGKDLTGFEVKSLVSAHASHLEKKYYDVITLRDIVYDEGEFENENSDIVKYRQCLVPLGENSGAVESILGAMRYKIFKNNK